MTWFSRIRSASSTPTGEIVRDDIVDFHTAHPGITEATLGALATANGLTGYDLLCGRIPDRASVALDLGCGNGPLLVRMLARTPKLARVIGVDLCASDLELARARADDSRLELLHTAGQDFARRLAPGSVDTVLSHHAFYLMDPIEPVIANIARVLRPGGVFAWVTSSPDEESSPVFSELMRRFGAVTAREQPHFRGWGDRRVWSLDGLRALFGPGSGFAATMRIDDFVLVAREPVEALIDRLLRFFYSAALQSEAGRRETADAWRDVLATTVRDGSAQLELPFAIVTLERTAD